MTEAITALVALTVMEIVLGIDNVILIAVVAARLPKGQQASARTLGLLLGLAARIGLLFALNAVATLDKHPAFKLSDLGIPAGWMPERVDAITWRDAVMLAGGVFLLYKATVEIHHKLEGEEGEGTNGDGAGYAAAIGQIVLLDIVFSLDSVVTAVGMAPKDGLWVMVTAMIVAMGVMLFFTGMISRFVEQHPTVKMLVLAFLMLIGVMLVADGLGQHVSKAYIYFAMAFSLGVEILNLRMKANREPVRLKEKRLPARLSVRAASRWKGDRRRGPIPDRAADSG